MSRLFDGLCHCAGSGRGSYVKIINTLQGFTDSLRINNTWGRDSEGAYGQLRPEFHLKWILLWPEKTRKAKNDGQAPVLVILREGHAPLGDCSASYHQTLSFIACLLFVLGVSNFTPSHCLPGAELVPLKSVTD